MFDQPYIPTMLFIILCFTGLMVMFFFISRSLEQMVRSLREERSELVGLLRAMDERLATLVAMRQGENRQAESASLLRRMRETELASQRNNDLDELAELEDDSWFSTVTEEDLALNLEAGSRARDRSRQERHAEPPDASFASPYASDVPDVPFSRDSMVAADLADGLNSADVATKDVLSTEADAAKNSRVVTATVDPVDKTLGDVVGTYVTASHDGERHTDGGNAGDTTVAGDDSHTGQARVSNTEPEPEDDFEYDEIAVESMRPYEREMSLPGFFEQDSGESHSRAAAHGKSIVEDEEEILLDGSMLAAAADEGAVTAESLEPPSSAVSQKSPQHDDSLQGDFSPRDIDQDESSQEDATDELDDSGKESRKKKRDNITQYIVE